MSSFQKRVLEVRITLDKGSFGGKGTQKIIHGLAVDAKIQKTGGFDMSKASCSISGLSLSDMEQMSVLAFRPLSFTRNEIEIYAGTEDSLHLVFRGCVTSAVANFNSAPDPSFDIEAQAGFYPSLMAKGPQAINGDANVADLIAQQAKEMGYAFENQGVTNKINNAYIVGDPKQKTQALAKQAGCTALIEDNKVTILPYGKEIRGDTIVLNKDSGMIGYPSFSSEGITVKAIYNPNFRMLGLVKVESIVPKASGTWRIVKLEHTLSAYHPDGGPWESSLTCSYPFNQFAMSQQGTV